MMYLANTKDPKSIWEFYPLPGDPSKEDINKAVKKQSGEDWDTYRNFIKELNSKGVKT